ESSAHPSDRNQVLASVNADDERSQHALLGSPTADHNLVAEAAFRLQPAAAAIGCVARIQALGDDSFHLNLTGRLQHRVAVGNEVLEVPDAISGLPAE